MIQERLTEISIIPIENKLNESIDIPLLIDKFAVIKARRALLI